LTWFRPVFKNFDNDIAIICSYKTLIAYLLGQKCNESVT